MNIDKILYFLLFLPFIWLLVFDQENLKKKNVFIKYLLISIGILILGIIYQRLSNTENKSLVYFGSQMTIIFLILYKVIRIPYYWIFKREPEISKYPEKLVDIIPTLIVIIGTIGLPLLIDIMVKQKLIQ
jgi:hypothetical protein